MSWSWSSRHDKHKCAGRGIGPVQFPAVYSNVFQRARFDARDVLDQHRCRLGAQTTTEWTAHADTLGLHRYAIGGPLYTMLFANLVIIEDASLAFLVPSVEVYASIQM